MDDKTFDLLVGLATIDAFLLELAEVLYSLCRKWSSRRIARQEKKREEVCGSSENK